MAKRRTKARGWAAISPQSVTCLPALLQALMTVARTRSTGGARGWQRWLTLGLSRSAAIRYWTRSLLPIDTKSTSGSMSLIEIAAAGTSSIIPSGTSANGLFSARSCWAARRTIAFSLRTSSTVVIIGNISLTCVPTVWATAAARENCAELCIEELRMFERQPNAAPTHERIGFLMGVTKVGNGFVAADIERANGDLHARTSKTGRRDKR